MKIKLKGAALAKEFARTHPLSEENPGKVWASYQGGGWIILRGEGLKPHPNMAAHYPNGWNLLARLRSGEARARIKDNHATLRQHYAACI